MLFSFYKNNKKIIDKFNSPDKLRIRHASEVIGNKCWRYNIVECFHITFWIWFPFYLFHSIFLCWWQLWSINQINFSFEPLQPVVKRTCLLTKKYWSISSWIIQILWPFSQKNRKCKISHNLWCQNTLIFYDVMTYN